MKGRISGKLQPGQPDISLWEGSEEILPECILKYGKVMESSQHGFIESISHVCLHSIFYLEVTDGLPVCGTL